jgi:hypothetical protein
MKIFNLLALIILLPTSALYPIWISNGYFDGAIIPAIGVAIAIYGGLIANLIQIFK